MDHDAPPKITDEEEIVPDRRCQKYSLEEIVASITDENTHEIVDWGEPVGNEIWVYDKPEAKQ